MSARSFGSLFMVASCAGAALGCYLVSLRVASERAALESVETKIVLAQRDLRVLQTEIGTRGRLSQLERWNAGAFSLSAPAAHQFVGGGFELARLIEPEKGPAFEAPVVLASAPAPLPEAPAIGVPAGGDAAPQSTAQTRLLHQASMKSETREVPARTVATLPPAAEPKSAGKPVTAAKPAILKPAEKLAKPADRPGLAAAQSRAEQTPKKAPAKLAESPAPSAKKSVDKPAVAAAKPVTKPTRIAKTDPLAPLADKQSGKAKGSPPAR